MNNKQLLIVSRIIIAVGILSLLACAALGAVNAFLPSVLVCCIGIIGAELAQAPTYGDDEQPIKTYKPYVATCQTCGEKFPTVPPPPIGQATHYCNKCMGKAFSKLFC